MEWERRRELAQIRAIRVSFFRMAAIIVFTAAGSKEEARRIANSLVESRMAACVNIIPKVEAVYRWENKVENAEEWLLLIKTTAAAFDSVRDAIKAMHSYDLPECIAVEISDAEDGYLKWLADSVFH